MSNSNYLKVIMGPMFSGKSSTLINDINKYRFITDKMVVVNSVLDKQRHSDMKIDENGIGQLKTHDSKTFPAIMLKNLSELNTNKFYNKKYLDSSIILIDEGQFYSDLYSFLKDELAKPGNKKFIVAGLSSDINQNPIGDIIKLIPLADDIIKLSAFCVYCKDATPGNFTKLLISSNSNSNIKVGAKEIYAPVCRKHFFSK
jgi:thymidine kinase